MDWVTVGLRRFVRDEHAPAMAEYGLLLAFVALVTLVAAVTLGVNLRDLFDSVAPNIGNFSPPPAAT